jgi:predicted alpha/beta-fold hydrolase
MHANKSRHKDILSKNPNLDLKKIEGAKYLYQWDRYVQCPTWGYPTEHAYYRDASSVDLANRVKIPTLALHAKDDPIITDIAVPYEMFRVNPYWTMVATANGGHLGWYEYGGNRWSSKTVSLMLMLNHAEADTPKIVSFLRKFVDDTDGMISRDKAPKIQGAVARQTDCMGNPTNWDPMKRPREYVKTQ